MNSLDRWSLVVIKQMFFTVKYHEFCLCDSFRKTCRLIFFLPLSWKYGVLFISWRILILICITFKVATNLENSGNLKNCENLREIWIFIEKTWKTQGKQRVCGIMADENVFQLIILSRISQGKVWKWPGNLRESSRNLVTQKCDHPDLPSPVQHTLHEIQIFEQNEFWSTIFSLWARVS